MGAQVDGALNGLARNHYTDHPVIEGSFDKPQIHWERAADNQIPTWL